MPLRYLLLANHHRAACCVRATTTAFACFPRRCHFPECPSSTKRMSSSVKILGTEPSSTLSKYLLTMMLVALPNNKKKMTQFNPTSSQLIHRNKHTPKFTNLSHPAQPFQFGSFSSVHRRWRSALDGRRRTMTTTLMVSRTSR
jgi:hypothetical protein